MECLRQLKFARRQDPSQRSLLSQDVRPECARSFPGSRIRRVRNRQEIQQCPNFCNGYDGQTAEPLRGFHRAAFPANKGPALLRSLSDIGVEPNNHVHQHEGLFRRRLGFEPRHGARRLQDVPCKPARHQRRLWLLKRPYRTLPPHLGHGPRASYRARHRQIPL